MMTDIKTMQVTAEQLESLSEVNRISALKIGEMQAEIDIYKKALEEIAAGDYTCLADIDTIVNVALDRVERE